LQQKDASEYASAIRARQRPLGPQAGRNRYVIDPSYRVRGAAGHGENVESALAREGIYCTPARTPSRPA
jgi:hypothetical protein